MLRASLRPLSKRSYSSGFTLVELTICIAVIAVLATISVVVYRGVQERATANVVMKDLQNAALTMEQAALKNPQNHFPTTLPAGLTTSNEHITLSLKSGGEGGSYENLTPVQSAALFEKVCDDLADEGYGKGTTNGGQEETWIGGCTVYETNEIQLSNSWGGVGRNISTPVTASTLPDLVEAVNYNDSWRPNRDTAEKAFFQEWHDRYLALGGTYPVTTFWNGTWCQTGQAWCTAYEPLPSPSQGGGSNDPATYCIEATHDSYPDLKWKITADDNKPEPGSCSG